jgi:hypothetical protein
VLGDASGEINRKHLSSPLRGKVGMVRSAKGVIGMGCVPSSIKPGEKMAWD